jgi:mycofactocin precursor
MDATQSTVENDQTADISSVIEADSLVEEVSIDGMCGVY